jgi:hypothetical protein
MGALAYDNGGRYEGELLGGLPHGQGSLVVTAPLPGVGHAEDGAPAAATAEAAATATLHITGTWADGLLHGHAVWRMAGPSEPFRETYDGGFVHGVREGAAVANLRDGSYYEGAYYNGRPNGHATVRYADKSLYTGKFIGGARAGKGTLVHANGDVYVGMFEAGVPHGSGVLRRAVSGVEERGTWVRGERRS